jgi:predicted enzyme related to lactoylglutathione lyase
LDRDRTGTKKIIGEVRGAMKARFVHVNLVAEDWKKLAQFYVDVFGCTRVPPERDLSGEWLDACTSVPGARVSGIHLRLPGYGDKGPTLEIFQYAQEKERAGIAINRPGIAHIAFAVDDVEAARKAVVEAGGGMVGDLVCAKIPGAGTITLVYATDPEGNILELQSWA